MKPVAPWWQWIVGLMFFSGAVGGFSLVSNSLGSLALSILLPVGTAATLGLLLRKKTVSVTLMLGDECVLIRDSSRANHGKLIPLRVERVADRKILVDRKGSRWELKRFELYFSSQEDVASAISMLGRFSSQSSQAEAEA